VNMKKLGSLLSREITP